MKAYSWFLSVLPIVVFCLISFKISAQQNTDLPTEDVLFIDDLIIAGNACIGFTCLNNEDFGSDVLRLDDNVLRLHFDDTSLAAGFPTNNWRIIINDVLSGGSNYFAIQDATAVTIPFRVEAGAKDHALYVDNTSKVGIGTNNPIEDIHIKVGDSPALRLEQDNSFVFTPQTWDIGGNEANFFVRDVTFGNKIPFKIRPDAPTNSLVIGETGDVGLGIAFPLERLHVIGNGFISGEFEVMSDLRIKQDITPVENASATINQLKPVTYTMRTNTYPELNLPTDKQYGLIAQEVQEILPELVSPKKSDGKEALEERMMSVNYIQLIPLLIKANQEQAEEIKALKKRLDKLEKS